MPDDDDHLNLEIPRRARVTREEMARSVTSRASPTSSPSQNSSPTPSVSRRARATPCRAASSTPRRRRGSPRFSPRAGKIPSVVADAPQRLTDALEGVENAAARATDLLARAERALEAFRGSVGASSDTDTVGHRRTPSDAVARRHWTDDVPAPVLLTRVPWGAHRTIEEWLWLCTAVVEGMVGEARVKSGVAAYLSGRSARRGREETPGGGNGRDGAGGVGGWKTERMRGDVEVAAVHGRDVAGRAG